ncbi:MAG: META domain-containing protein [Psychrobacter sp.]|nr:META domain-containing protein [Psychrobacter sp.]
MIQIKNISARLLIISILAPISLLGCQTNRLPPVDIGAVPTPPVKDEIASIKAQTKDPLPTDSRNLITTLNRYQWQLTKVISSPNHKMVDDALIKTIINAQYPLIMEVQPSAFLLHYGCQQYRLSVNNYYPPPFSYSFDYVSEVAHTSCDNPTANSPLNSPDKADLKSHLQRLFITEYSKQFYFDLSPAAASTRKLQIKMEDGTILVWQGQLKPLQPVAGIPITSELLARYQWHLKRALSSRHQPIPELNHKDLPILAFFRTDISQSYVRFSTGCNGVGGPYILTADQRLLIGSAPQTVMGCSNLLESIEGKVSGTLLNSQSQLTLALAPTEPDTITNTITKDKTAYWLTQKLDTGETLIWENEAPDKP